MSKKTAVAAEKLAAINTHLETAQASYARIPLSRLVINEANARRSQESGTAQRQARFWELVASVREKGVIETLLVRPLGRDKYAIIAGERRFRAASHVAEELGIPLAEYEVPCLIREVDEDEAFDLMIIENLQREDLTPFETATAFDAYLARHGRSADAASELAARTGIPAHAIRRMVRLLALPEPVRDAWREGRITQSHAELFTRLDDKTQGIELLEACLRSKLTVRELAERIGAIAVDLANAFFDQEECQRCPFNTSVQSGLFADLTPAGKCGGAACFETKQAAFLTEHWSESKAAGMFGTRTFRFGHRLEVAAEIIAHDPADRCLACDAFASILRLSGAVVSGYARTCIGPRTCFEEIYCNLPPMSPTSPASQGADDAPIVDRDGCGRNRESCPEDGSTCPDCLDAGDDAESAAVAQNLGAALADARNAKNPPPPPPADAGPVFNAARGEQMRKLFIREALPAAVAAEPAESLPSQRLVLVALALASPAVRKHLCAGLGLPDGTLSAQMTAAILQVPREDIAAEVVAAALDHLLNDLSVNAKIGLTVARSFGLDLARDWRLTEGYLASLTKSEIVRIGEEPGVALWNDAQVMAYRKAHHKGKALHALGKTELIDCILKSGIDLAGRVPAEIVGKG